MIKIEKGVQIPTDGARTEIGKAVRKLKVGESFIVPLEYTKALQNAAYINLRPGNYTTRKEGDKLRLWRTK